MRVEELELDAIVQTPDGPGVVKDWGGGVSHKPYVVVKLDDGEWKSYRPAECRAEGGVMDYGDVNKLEDSPSPKTSSEAMGLAMAWASGVMSHQVDIRQVAHTDRPEQTYAAIIEADAAEAVKWARIAATLNEMEFRSQETEMRINGLIS